MEAIKLHQFAEKLELRGYSKRTIKDSPSCMGMFLRYLEETESVRILADVKPEHFTAYHLHLQYHRTKQGKYLTNGSVVRYLDTVRRFYRVMFDEKLIDQDYAPLITVPKRKKHLPRNVPTEKDMLMLLGIIEPAAQGRSACTEYSRNNPLTIRDKAMLEFLYATGVRNEELRTLSVESIDLTERTAFVTGKGSKDRIVPIGDWVIPYLVEYLATARPKLLNPRDSSSLLFISKCGYMLTSCNLGDIIKRYAKKAELDIRITPHSFRHACATHLLKGGADIRYVQELLGHSDLVSTQIYTKVDISMLKQAHKRFHPRERIYENAEKNPE
jgi:integrase/recombinase XerD